MSINPTLPNISFYNTPDSRQLTTSTTAQVILGANNTRKNLKIQNLSSTAGENIIISFRSNLSQDPVDIHIIPAGTNIPYYTNRDNQIGGGEYSIRSALGSPQVLIVNY